MKKFILNFLFLFCIVNFGKAQVIDLVGKGTFEASSSNLPLSETFNIDSV